VVSQMRGLSRTLRKWSRNCEGSPGCSGSRLANCSTLQDAPEVVSQLRGLSRTLRKSSRNCEGSPGRSGSRLAIERGLRSSSGKALAVARDLLDRPERHVFLRGTFRDVRKTPDFSQGTSEEPENDRFAGRELPGSPQEARFRDHAERKDESTCFDQTSVWLMPFSRRHFSEKSSRPIGQPI